MKKFKMFLIAFSLLACSSFAFATEIEGKEKEILKVLNDVVAEKNNELQTKLTKDYIFENKFLKVLDENNLKIKNVTQNKFFSEIAEEIAKNYFLLKRKNIIICKNLIKKDDSEDIECYKFEIIFCLNEPNEIKIKTYVSRNEKIEEKLKIKTNLEENLKNEISKHLKNEKEDENNLVEILDNVNEEDENIYKKEKISYVVFLNSILSYFIEKIKKDENKKIEKTIKIIEEENKESVKYSKITITYNPTNIKNPYKMKVKENELFKQNENINLKDVAFKGEKIIDFSKLQEDLKDFTNGRYLYCAKNAKNYFEFKPINLNDLEKEIVNNIRNFYKNREFLFLTENKIEAKDEFLCCEKYFIKKDEIDNLENIENINAEKIAFFYKKNRIYVKKLNKQKSFENLSKIDKYEVEKAKEKIEKKNKQIKKLSDFLNKNKFVENGKIYEIKPRGLRYDDQYIYKKNLNSFLKEKIDELEKCIIECKNYNLAITDIYFYLMKDKKNLYSFSIDENEKNGELVIREINCSPKKIPTKDELKKENLKLLEYFNNDEKKIKYNFFTCTFHDYTEYLYKTGFVLPNQLINKVIFNKNNPDVLEIKKINSNDFIKELYYKILNKINKNPEEYYYKIDLEDFFIKFDTIKNDNFNESTINKLTPYRFLFDRNDITYLTLSEEKNEYLTYLYKKKELNNKIYQALYNIKNKNKKHLYNNNCKIVEIDPETLKEKKSLTLEDFSNEISNKIDYDYEEEKFKDTEFKLNNYYVINNTLKKNKLQCKSFNIKFEKEKKNPIEIKEDFNRNLAENLLKKVVEKLEKNEFKEDNFYYKDYNLGLDSSYEHFKIDEKEFDEILTKENLLKDGKIEIFDVEKNKTISLTLNQFKILAKQTVLFFETRGPKIENIIKKNEHKSEEDEFLVNLHLDYDLENKTIKIKNIVNSKNKIKKFLKEQFNFNDLKSPKFIMPDVLYFTNSEYIAQNCHNTSDKKEHVETLYDSNNVKEAQKIKNIKFNEEEKNLLNIFFERNSSTYKSAEKNEREKFLEEFLTNLNENFENEIFTRLFYYNDNSKNKLIEKEFTYSFELPQKKINPLNQLKIKIFKIKLKAIICDVEKIEDEYKNKGKLFKHKTYKKVYKLKIEIKDEEKNETIFLKNRFVAPKICFNRKDLIEGNLNFKAAFQKNSEETDKEKIVYDYEKLNEAADAIEDAFTEEINNKKDGFNNAVIKIFPDYNIKITALILRTKNQIKFNLPKISELTEEGKKAFIKTEKYNLNFFKEKDENKLKNLKIAENEEDLELIKNEIVNKLEEEDLIKLKKITLAGKTPYVIPLKLKIEYNNENEKAKYFKLEIYYSVSLKEFKVKNIKTITKEEYDKII